MDINGSTQIAGVFGSPIAHTASPAMHNAAFAASRLNWVYVACHVEPAQLRSALHGARDMHWAGVNLTVPHKLLALDLVDAVDPEARELGAVNTVVIRDGHLTGYNTDGYGFEQALREDFGMELAGRNVLILGAGGAGRALAVKCARAGVGKLFVTNRTPANLTAVLRDIAAIGTPATPVEFHGPALAAAIHEVDLVVNATSVGLKPDDSLHFDTEWFSGRHCVFDTIYNPAETELLRIARTAGARVANGLGMLLHQGARAFELWTQQPAPVEVMRRALRGAIYGDPV